MLNHLFEKELVLNMEGIAALMGFLGGMLIFAGVILIALLVLIIVSNVFIWRTMGLPGRYANIPSRNLYTQFQRTWSPMPWFWVYLALVILSVFVGDGFLGFVISIASLVFAIVANWQLCKAFGKGPGWCVGICLLPIVFLPMLAFGSSQYIGNTYTNG